MNHFTNFFTKLEEYFKDVDLTVQIKEKNGKYTVMVVPQAANNNGLKPLSVTGTPKELDDGFFGEVQKRAAIMEGLRSNVEELKQDAAELSKNATAKKPEPEKTVKDGKSAKATAKAKTSKEKPATGKKRKVKPAGTQAEAPDIFSQAPADPEDTDGGEGTGNVEHEEESPVPSGDDESAAGDMAAPDSEEENTSAE